MGSFEILGHWLDTTSSELNMSMNNIYKRGSKFLLIDLLWTQRSNMTSSNIISTSSAPKTTFKVYLWCVTNTKYDRNSANFMASLKLTSWYVTLEIQFIKNSQKKTENFQIETLKNDDKISISSDMWCVFMYRLVKKRANTIRKITDYGKRLSFWVYSNGLRSSYPTIWIYSKW